MNMFKKIGKIFLLVILCLFLVIGIPIIINEMYKVESGYVTLWGASDVLEFYAVILSGLITIATFIATIHFTREDTKTQLKFQSAQANAPFFIIDSVSHLESKFNKSNDNFWKETIYLGDTYDKPNNDFIELCLNNIGSGPAIDINCSYNENKKINNKTNVFINETVNIKYKYGQLVTDDNITETTDDIILSYKNISGIEYYQNIIIVANVHRGNRKITITVKEITSRVVK